MSTIVLGDRDCALLLEAPGVLDRVARAVVAAHVGLHRGTALNPVPAVGRDARADIDGEGVEAPAVVPMTAHDLLRGRSAVKLLADAPANRARGLPAQRSTVALYDSADAACLALADGRSLTRVRTAVVSAVATRALAQPGRVLGLVGAGALAVEHVRAHAELVGVDEVVVWSRSAASRARFTDDVARRSPQVRVLPVTEVHEVFEAADVVCTLTPADRPLVSRKVLRPGLHVTALGSPPRPSHAELDPDVFEDVDRVVVDDVHVARGESGNVRGGLAAGTLREAELIALGAVLDGAATGRRRPSDVTVFNSVGLGVQDLAVLDLLHREAVAAGTGERVALRD